LADDPLTVITEDGVLFVDDEARRPELRGNINFIPNAELLEKQWRAKLYIHNTPHCIAAYLGALLDKQFLHEAMEVVEVNAIVEGVMHEMQTSLKLGWDIPHEFLDWYANKELSRFRNKLLCDPITRVAREPIRKLELDGRLIGAANICLSKGFIPENIFVGIVAALLFKGREDKDRHLPFIRDAVDRDYLLTYVLGLRKGEAIELALSESYENIKRRLLALVTKYNN
jgi:mannitol-1-phosphate/altronate dehydrogenase